MTLASRLSHFVDWRVRERGREYWRMGQVEEVSSEPLAVEAVVTGTEKYHVRLQWDGDDLRAGCTCPFSEKGAICKHVWAVILDADTRKALRGPEGELPKRLLSFAAEAERAPDSPPSPSWRDSFNQIALTTVPSPPPPVTLDGREILYLMDVPPPLKDPRINLRMVTGVRGEDGAWRELKPLSLSREALPQLPEPDRTLLSLLSLAAAETAAQRWSPVVADQVPAVAALSASAARLLIPQLGATGRLWTRVDKRPGEPVAWDGGPPWEVWLEVREEAGGDCVLAASLRRGDERIGAEARPAVLGNSGFVLAGGRVASVAGGLRWAPLLQPEKAVRVPAADRDELVRRLLADPQLPPLDLPAPLRFEEVRAVPRPLLRLLPPRWNRDSPRAALSFVYEGQEVEAFSSLPGLFQPTERRFLVRDREAEERSAARLRELGFRTEPQGFGETPSMYIATSRIPGAVAALLAEDWRVEAEGKLYRPPGAFRMNVTSGVDWFDLEGEADFEGQTVPLPRILEAVRKGAGFVVLGDGSLGMLPEEWIERLTPLARLGTAEGEAVRFRSVQAVLLDAWLADQPEVEWDERFESARRRLHDFAGIAPADPPPGFQGELRPYQRAGLGWLHFLRELGFGGCLADDMGLGKTVQVLALLESRRARREREGLPPSLVVVPRSLVFNWLAEAARFTPRLRVLDYTGAGRFRADERFEDYDLVLTTYGTMRQDVGALREMEFDYLILDEAQAIKNASSQTAKAARLLRGRHRLALTGTPVENHLGELWSLLEFLNPGFLGASALRAHAEELRHPSPEARGVLARALRPFILRRTKEAVAPELPAKVEQTIFCDLPPRQRKLYDEMRDYYRNSLSAQIGERGMARARILILEALLRLRQAACHPGLLDEGRADEPSAKLDLLLLQLREVLDEGHKALVFSQFTSFLGLLRRSLDAEKIPYLYLDGRTRDRQEKVEAFQSDPKCRLFLISLKAGGLGLNLTAADYVYLLDPWWNPAVEAQAIDRAHRIGQERPVFASRLVARDTVEEKILELQKSKRDLADAVIQEDRGVLASLSREDLELLLS